MVEAQLSNHSKLGSKKMANLGITMVFLRQYGTRMWGIYEQGRI
jgi:hypothetical protein